MRNRFDLQLKQLNNDVIEMGNMIERAIEMAVYALVAQDKEKAKQAIAFDMDIDHMERDIEALCMKLLLQQQPVARDLRQISSALKLITDMERIGDQAADIAELSLQLGDVSYVDNLDLIQKMANETMSMVVRGTEAFVTKDMDLAHEVINNDDVVDDLFDQVKNYLIGLIQDNHEKSFQAADLLMVAKYFERIGDHATNIAEWVIYSITGKHEDEE
ncbi:MAG: phosphate signaling complex protein PhoU [Coprococcus sp.]